MISSLGFEVFDVRDFGLRGKSDKKVFDFAQRHKAVLFSADLGFAKFFRSSLRKNTVIVILRFPNEMPVSAINQETQRLISKLKPEDYYGNLIILSPGKIRLRSHKQN
jgi:predicted nuclease of predicted toxin-antitoxin system